ncbi:MAG: DUF1499 domain-containing protein, partial [Pseudomonadota bacterium]
APSDLETWHVDPISVEPPRGKSYVLLRPGSPDGDGPLLNEAPETALAAFDKVVMATPRTTRLAGSVADGRVTYVTRSRLWGFPDYTSVKAVPEGDGTRLAIFARQRFGSSDWGQNRARVDAWLAALPGTS